MPGLTGKEKKSFNIFFCLDGKFLFKVCRCPLLYFLLEALFSISVQLIAISPQAYCFASPDKPCFLLIHFKLVLHFIDLISNFKKFSSATFSFSVDTHEHFSRVTTLSFVIKVMNLKGNSNNA